jgi:hypothetical protein
MSPTPFVNTFRLSFLFSLLAMPCAMTVLAEGLFAYFFIARPCRLARPRTLLAEKMMCLVKKVENN